MKTKEYYLALIPLWKNKGTLDKRLASRGSRRGHKHIVGVHFESRNLTGITPAEYRRRHLGIY